MDARLIVVLERKKGGGGGGGGVEQGTRKENEVTAIRWGYTAGEAVHCCLSSSIQPPHPESDHGYGCSLREDQFDGVVSPRGERSQPHVQIIPVQPHTYTRTELNYTRTTTVGRTTVSITVCTCILLGAHEALVCSTLSC